MSYIPAKNYSILEGLSDAAIATALGSAQIVDVPRGTLIAEEGKQPPALQVIVSGRLTVFRATSGGNGRVVTATLGAGDIVGEEAMVSGAVATSTLVARDDVQLRRLAIDHLEATDRAVITGNVLRVLMRRVRHAQSVITSKHEEQMHAYQLQLAASMFLTRSLMLLSIYMLALPVSELLTRHTGSPSTATSLLIAMFFLVSLHFVRRSGIPYWLLGLSLAGWKSQVGRALLYSLSLVAILVGCKVGLAVAFPGKFHIIEPNLRQSLAGTDSLLIYVGVATSYCILTFAQEFIRSTVQGSLTVFQNAAGGTSRWMPLLVANVIFAALHMHLGPMFAAAAFLIGLFWGWVFLRTRSCLAVGVSHAFIGVVMIFIFGVPS